MATLAMIDTLRIDADWPLKERHTGDAWKATLAPGLRVEYSRDGTKIRTVQSELAVFHFRDHVHELENPAQIDAALGKLHAAVSRIADVPPIETWKPWRVDLVRNYNLPAKAIILGHFGLRIPGIRSEPSLLKGGAELVFRAAKGRFELVLYDKSRQQGWKGDCLRVEARLCGHIQLARHHLCDGQWRNFEALYRAYRKILVSVPPIVKPVAHEWQESLGAESFEAQIRILGRMASTTPGRTMRRWKQRVCAAASSQPETFSWENILPVSGPPPSLDPNPPGTHGHVLSVSSDDKANTPPWQENPP